MPFMITAHGLILFVTAFLSFIVGFSAFRHRRNISARILIFLMLAIFIYTFSSAMQSGIADLSSNILWAKISYIGYVWLTPLCFFFVLSYTDQLREVNGAGFTAIGTIPLVTLALVWTNQWHKLVWKDFLPGEQDLNIIIYEHGTWFFVFLVFQVCMYTITLFVLLRNLNIQKRPYRQQSLIILAATLLPALAGLMYGFDLSPIPGLDWMPVLIFFTGLLFYWGIFHYRLLDLVPIARDILIEQMLDGMIVLDKSQRIIDINQNARKMIPEGEKINIGDLVCEALPFLKLSPLEVNHDPDAQVVSLKGESSGKRFIDFRHTPIRGERAGIRGSLLILMDITQQKELEDSLTRANRQLEEQLKNNQRLQALLKEESIRDPLTRLYNRRYLEDALQREAARALRNETPIAFIMADIDHFKLINDKYGHGVGDEILKLLAQTMLSRFRLEDIICRYGGEEFLIMMPATDILAGYSKMEKFRSELENTDMDTPAGKVRITLSAGVAAFPKDGAGVDSVLKIADNNLYIAKATGRNRVVASRDQSD